MKKMIVYAMVAMMAFSICACGSKGDVNKREDQNTSVSGDSQQIPNPWQDCDSITDAQKNVGFDMNVPDKVGDYTQAWIQTMDKEMIQVDYTFGEEEVLIRKAASKNDPSGDYNAYNKEENVNVGDLSVTMKGNEDRMNLAVWSDGTYSYSVYASAGMSQDMLAEIVAQVQ